MTKNKIFRNVLSITLALFLTLGAIPFSGMDDLSLPSIGSITANAAEEIEWTVATKEMLILSDDGTTIKGYTDKLSGNIEISDKIDGTEIIKIESKAFEGCEALTAIKIPQNIKEIGLKAFQKCANLETVFFNANNCVISDSSESYASFSFCDNLTKFIFGEGTKTIPAKLCAYVRNLQTVEFNSVVEKVGDNAFLNCSSLETVNYAGTEKDKAEIVFGKNNDYLINATWTCKEEENPIKPDIPDEPDIPEKPEIPELIDAENIALNYKGSVSIAKKEFEKYDVTYESSNPEIITVDEDGKITAIGNGTAVITATVTVDGEVIEDEVTVTTTYAWWQWIIVIVLFGWLWY